MSLIAYHGTDAEFTAFDTAYAVQPDRASNGYLGVWLSLNSEIASRFGARVVEVQVKSDLAFDLSVAELSRMHHHAQTTPDNGASYYKQYSDNLIARGYDLIRIIELDGTYLLVVGLLPQHLTIVGT